ncbi:ATP-dependent nuclease [Clostridium perfringens]|nr:AAA family ATPase [Clostridium perfringens]ELC8412958.1 AAA family ATPase [Clostridium perfringens]HAT4112297.1 AAA family ATPase [Clostridium perfringens]
MYLKKLKISNFRKFGIDNNTIEFVQPPNNALNKDKEKINIAKTTTLIVGKNNSGKTTIIQALNKIINENKLKYNDFNLIYIKKLVSLAIKNPKELKNPFIEFTVTIGLDEKSTDLISNLIPFMTLEDINKSEIDIIIRYEVEDKEIFINNFNEIFKKYTDENLILKKFLELIDQTEFKLNYYNKNDQVIEKFRLGELIELRPIKANNIEGENSLSKAFSKIIEYRYNILLEDDKETLETQIMEINRVLTEKISSNHTSYINDSLRKVISNNKLKVLLSADLNFQKLMSNLIKYEHIENENVIPENQFGLGYTHLMMIIANLIEYMEKYPEDSFNSKINLISIEEPETFMHPQMQECFIKNINNAIITLLENKNKNVNSQLILTTHSSHILNSKIHTGNTFNNINYVFSKNGLSNVINLNDKKITPNDENDFKFLKKHIKYKVSELFFSDAIILVEGITEYTLLPYYIDLYNDLSKYYISLFNINGAHGLVYNNLIKVLKVPTLIITDLDIKRNENEKKSFYQVDSIEDKETTNQTIIKNNNNCNLINNINDFIKDENIYIAYQGKINDYYATSFEEAFILTNYNNGLLNKVLKNTKPKIYNEIVGEDENIDFKNNLKNSYKWQCKLSNDKSNFANELLYNLIIEENCENIPKLPKYIKNGFDILTKDLKGE